MTATVKIATAALAHKGNSKIISINELKIIYIIIIKLSQNK
jgi:hypothetical protein